MNTWMIKICQDGIARSERVRLFMKYDELKQQELAKEYERGLREGNSGRIMYERGKKEAYGAMVTLIKIRRDDDESGVCGELLTDLGVWLAGEKQSNK